jgi:uncharacterized membrane protein YhaH (DUF805 family)
MTQAATFGRRGTVAPPPSARPTQSRPAARSPAPAAQAWPRAAPTAAPKAAPKAADDSLLGYFLWLLFSFDRRLDRRTYRYARIAANLGFLFLSYQLEAALPKNVGNPGVELLLALTLLGLVGVMLWSTLAMQVKRRHDRDKAWPWLFVGFIPIIGPIWVLVETCWLDGTPGYNRFDDPAKTAAAVFS